MLGGVLPPRVPKTQSMCPLPPLHPALYRQLELDLMEVVMNSRARLITWLVLGMWQDPANQLGSSFQNLCTSSVGL